MELLLAHGAGPPDSFLQVTWLLLGFLAQNLGYPLLDKLNYPYFSCSSRIFLPIEPTLCLGVTGTAGRG